jgi:hypothetical protein
MEPQFCLSFYMGASPGLSHYREKWSRGVLQQEPEEDIWVQDESIGRWRKWHKNMGGRIILK